MKKQDLSDEAYGNNNDSDGRNIKNISTIKQNLKR